MKKIAGLALALMLATSGPVNASDWRGPIRLTWYGSDFYGKPVACPGNGPYSRWSLGFATWLPLPCGTLIEVRWRGRSVVAPIIDRMPRHDWVVLDASALIACHLLNHPKSQGKCFTRSDVKWRVVRRG